MLFLQKAAKAINASLLTDVELVIRDRCISAVFSQNLSISQLLVVLQELYSFISSFWRPSRQVYQKGAGPERRLGIPESQIPYWYHLLARQSY
jgi:hypothetical protein